VAASLDARLEAHGLDVVRWYALAAGSFLIAVATAVLASAYPSWKASRLAIVDALRHNR
jgi:putative ABC transport system permease protein